MAPRPPSVLFVAPEPLGSELTGPARRAVKLAEVLREHCRVTLLEAADRNLVAAAAGHDVTVTQALPSPRRLLAVRRSAPRLVVDLIAPFALEVAEVPGRPAERAAQVEWRTRQMLDHLALADLVLCTNGKQQDLLLGAGLAANLLLPAAPGVPLHERLVVVPHGVDPQPAARPQAPALRTGELAGEGPIVVWAGGMWGWLDPLTAIRAVERLRGAGEALRLAFIGFEHPDADTRRAHQPRVRDAMDYVSDRGVEGIVFRPGWLRREAYVGQLLEADVGIVLSGPSLEARFASRTRVCDYLQAGLPVVCTSGDAMSDLVRDQGLGEIVAAGDVDRCVAALAAVTRSPPHVPPGAIEPLLWPNVARPLVRYCSDLPAPGAPGLARQVIRTAASYPAFARAVFTARHRGERR